MSYKDMTLCRGGLCPLKTQCKRHEYYLEGKESEEVMSVLAVPMFEYNDEGRPECEYFIDKNQMTIC